MKTQNTNYIINSFIKFLDEFDKYCVKKNELMEMELLHLISEIFNYQTLSLTKYEDNKFCRVNNIGKLGHPDTINHYAHHFQKVDPYAKHISLASKDNFDINIFQSSDVLRKNYFDSKYFYFLKDYNLCWALTAEFDGYRLTFYKTHDEEDFCLEDHQTLKLVSSIIQKQHRTNQEILLKDFLWTSADNQLDAIGIGHIITDSSMRIISCNNIAYNLFKNKLQHGNSQLQIDELCGEIIKKVILYANLRTPILYKNYLINVCDEHINGTLFYCITIKPNDPAIEHSLAAEFNITQREMDVVSLIVKGKSYQEVADDLFISINTVRSHIKSIYKKTGITNQRMLCNLFK